MANKKRRSSAIFQVADGAGGIRPVVDLRFDDSEWPIRFSVEANQASAWMAHLSATLTERGLPSSGMGQLHADENSGSLTIHLTAAQPGPTFDIVWEKERRGPLQVSARPGGEPAADLVLLTQFIETIAERVRTGHIDRHHQRRLLKYEGLPWKGELWLSDTVRLGPPSKHPDSLLGPQIVIVDAMVDGIGHQGVRDNFSQLLRELRLVLSPIIGIYLEDADRRSEWVTEIEPASGQILNCRLQLVGYTETQISSAFPIPGSAPPSPLESVNRPNPGRYGIWPDDTEERVPHDTVELWRSFQSLPQIRQAQYLGACNAYLLARLMWPDQRTAYATFHVIACEALKHAGKRYDKYRIYDVIASLVDQTTALELQQHRLAPQSIRSKHVHRGELVADDLASGFLTDFFADPSFDEMLRILSQATRICLIEWLRKGGEYSLRRLNPKPVVSARATKAPSSRK